MDGSKTYLLPWVMMLILLVLVAGIASIYLISYYQTMSAIQGKATIRFDRVRIDWESIIDLRLDNAIVLHWTIDPGKLSEGYASWSIVGDVTVTD